MKKALFVGVLCLALSVGFLLTGCGPGEDKAGNQTTCPMDGGLIDEEIYVDYEGNRVYFCCVACTKKFSRDADAQMKKMADDGVILEVTPE